MADRNVVRVILGGFEVFECEGDDAARCGSCCTMSVGVVAVKDRTLFWCPRQRGACEGRMEST